MRKLKISILVVMVCFIAQMFSVVFAHDAYLNNAIRKYKRGNYSGCIQDLQAYTHRHSNATAYYYLGMAYAHAGNKTQAISAYKKAMIYSTNSVLFKAAYKGQVCLVSRELCDYNGTVAQSEIDRVVNSKNYMSTKVSSQVEQQRLNALRQHINNTGDVSNKQLRKVDPRYRSEIETSNRIAFAGSSTSGEYSPIISSEEQNIPQALKVKVVTDVPQTYTSSPKTQDEVAKNLSKKEEKMPTNDEIVNAMNVLKRAGFGNLVQQPVSQNLPQQNNNASVEAMNAIQKMTPEMAQLQSMLGNNKNNDNSMYNMIPYMVQGSNGQNPAISKEAMQAMILNQMMSSVDFSSKDDNNK